MSYQTDCSICYEEVGEKNCCITECGHHFCLKCILTSTQYNDTCPMCRTKLLDTPVEDEGDAREEGEIVEYEEEDEEDDYSEEEDEEPYSDGAKVEEIVERFQSKGVTMLDLVSMLLNRYSKDDVRYTNNYIEELTDKVYTIV